MRALKLPDFFLVTDDRRGGDPRQDVCALDAGGGVILRHYDDPHRALLAQELARLCRRRGLPLVVAADPSLALSVRAAGVHWPQWLLARARPRTFHPRHWLVTASVHDTPATRCARRLGVHAVLVSPVFPTASHPEAHPLGPVRFAALVRTIPLPAYALGGMSSKALKRLKPSGAVGFAAVSALTAGTASRTPGEYSETASSARNGFQ